ncbi:MAG: hypothetical protein II038_03845 [Lachnospiraceae bacterium]|nr:hypothetical protein [Lachnospiraceae bacterium]
MDIEYAKTLSYESIRKLYKSHLESLELGKNTVGTVTGDTFYLWNNAGKDVFWNTVTSDDFENTARQTLLEALTKNSSGNVPKLIDGYVSNLRRFREFIYQAEVEKGKDDAT